MSDHELHKIEVLNNHVLFKSKDWVKKFKLRLNLHIYTYPECMRKSVFTKSGIYTRQNLFEGALSSFSQSALIRKINFQLIEFQFILKKYCLHSLTQLAMSTD